MTPNSEFIFRLPKDKQKKSKKGKPSREMQKNCMTVAMLKVLQYFCRALAVIKILTIHNYGLSFF